MDWHGNRNTPAIEEITVSKTATNIVRNVLDLSGQMMAISAKPETEQVEDDVAVLLCVVRDYAYRIKQTADREKAKLEMIGQWEEGKK